MINLSSVIFDAIESKTSSINTAIPARVEAVDGYDLDVKPLILKRTGRGYVSLPTVYSVPFVTPSVGNIGVFFIPKVGDEVLLIVCKDDFDVWYETAKEAKPNDTTSFNLSNAIAICGFSSLPNREDTPKENELRIQNKETKIVIKANGDIVINDGNKHLVSYEDLVSQVAAMNTLLIGHFHLDPTKPDPKLGALPNFTSTKIEGITTK